MAAEERYDIWQLSTLFERDDSECAAAARFPVDREVFWVGFDEVGVPSILTDAQVIVALFSAGGAAEYVACVAFVSEAFGGAWVGGSGCYVRYLDARTKRPDIGMEVW